MGKTKIIATFGPASDSPPVMESMVTEGVSCARINLSHGTKEGHRELISNLKRIRDDREVPLSILADTKGPEVRLEPAVGEEVQLEDGDRVHLGTEETGEEEGFLVDFPGLPGLLDRGDQVIIGDGDLTLVVDSVGDTAVECRAASSGTVRGKQRITIPGTSFPLPPITDQDKEDIRFAVSEGVDWIALSFVKGPAEIRDAKEIIKEAGDGTTLPVMAKIETVEAVRNVEEIAREADALMVARGDMAMAIGLEEVPFLQKKIIRLANNLAKPVVTATQMLETMMHAPTPTRAEVTDVANAVLDGTDAIMLSGETAIGSYPTKTVATMRKIAEKAEANFSPSGNLEDEFDGEETRTAPEIGRAACSMAARLGAGAIITSTRSGYTARLVSRFRPRIPIVAVTPSRDVYNQLALAWGVEPLQVETTQDTDRMIEKSIRSVKEEGYVDDGDRVVVTAGVPFAVEGTTNLIKVDRVG